MYDVMIDLETADNRAGGAIVSIGAVFFSAKEGKLGDQFYKVVYLPSCEEAGLRVSEDTLAWWAEQAPEVQATMKASTSRRKSKPLADVLYAFTEYLRPAGENVRPWSNGADFDQPILAAAYYAIGLMPPWKFWNGRCFRTLKNMPGARRVVPAREGTHHNALDDAVHQAQHAMAILAQLKSADD
jgi:exodeoxyribonuclease VIII